MKKKKNGFILIEGISVSIIILTTLLLLYSQFVVLETMFSKTFKYNQVDDLYMTNNLVDFFKTENMEYIKTYTNGFLDLTSCPSLYIGEVAYCKALLSGANVEKIIISEPDVSFYVDVLDNSFNEGFKNYMKTIHNEDDYKIIVEYKTGTYAYLNVRG